MKLKVWELGGKLQGNSHFIQAEDIVLPQGFGVEEKCVVGVMVNVHGFDVLEATTLLVSDPRWSGAKPSPNYDIPTVFSYTGGREKVEEMINTLLQEWEEATQKKAYIQIRIEENLKNDFYSKCEENFQNPSAVIRGLIKKYVEEEK